MRQRQTFILKLQSAKAERGTAKVEATVKRDERGTAKSMYPTVKRDRRTSMHDKKFSTPSPSTSQKSSQKLIDNDDDSGEYNFEDLPGRSQDVFTPQQTKAMESSMKAAKDAEDRAMEAQKQLEDMKQEFAKMKQALLEQMRKEEPPKKKAKKSAADSEAESSVTESDSEKQKKKKKKKKRKKKEPEENKEEEEQEEEEEEEQEEEEKDKKQPQKKNVDSRDLNQHSHDDKGDMQSNSMMRMAYAQFPVQGLGGTLSYQEQINMAQMQVHFQRDAEEAERQLLQVELWQRSSRARKFGQQGRHGGYY